jgi:hypothetical protein
VKGRQDAYGRMLMDALEGRQDGVEIAGARRWLHDCEPLRPALYLTPFRRWPPHQRRAMRLALACSTSGVAGGQPVMSAIQPIAPAVRGVDEVKVVGERSEAFPIALESSHAVPVASSVLRRDNRRNAPLLVAPAFEAEADLGRDEVQ